MTEICRYVGDETLPPTITKEDWAYELEHSRSGNGWVIVMDLGDDYFKVVSVGRDKIGSQAFTAWGKMLKRSPLRVLNPNDPKSPMIGGKLSSAILDLAVDLRRALKGGTKLIGNNGWIT